MICGDWNLVQDHEKDTYNYANVNNPKARNAVINLKSDLNLIDLWRSLNPESRKYTWRRQNPFQQARLDFFLISSELQNLIEMADISPGYRTDHSLVVISLTHAVIECGRGAWKYNNSLLQYTEYLYKIRQEWLSSNPS